MVYYIKENLFESPAKVLVNTVNTVGVMGKGIALTFKMIFPEMFREYQKLCETGALKVGNLWLYKTPHKWILNFPTKIHWRQPSRTEYITAGLEKFLSIYSREGITSIGFPQLGCGNGELDWDAVVRPIMQRYLEGLPIDVLIYLYDGRSAPPEHRNIAEMKQWLRSEPETLAFDEMWMDLREAIGHGLRLKPWGIDDSPFSVKFAANGREGLSLSRLPGVLMQQLRKQSLASRVWAVLAGSHVTVPREAMLVLWQAVRSSGFCVPRTMPEGLDTLSSYLLPVLEQLTYLTKVELTRTADCGQEALELGLRLRSIHGHAKAKPNHIVQDILPA